MTRDELIAAIGDCEGCGASLEDSCQEVCDSTVWYKLSFTTPGDPYPFGSDTSAEGDHNCRYECRSCITEVTPRQRLIIAALIGNDDPDETAEALERLEQI